MKKLLLLQCFFWATLSVTFGQNYVNFGIRYQGTVKGDMIVVGNSILNVGNYPANNAYTGTQGDNSQIELNYANVSPEAGVFNSSNATVADPNPSSNCKKVLRAYLYWAAAYTQERISNQRDPRLERSKFSNVKFKVGTGVYRDLVGERVYDGNDIVSQSSGGTNSAQRAYVYRADVTQYLTSIAGTYTVGNIQAPKGRENTGVGYAAGWTLVIVYEDLTKPARNITLFDGFSVVNRDNNPTINISGFRTVPTGPVNAKIGFAALEGELGIQGDRLDMRNKSGNFVPLSAPERPSNNFFNSKITNESGANTNRRPASQNLLGFDAGVFELANSGKTFLTNNDTSATFRPYSNQDAYYPFMFAFNVEVIVPHIVMEKRVLNSAGVDITGQNVQMGQSLRYKIRFQNIGNDDAKDVVITDKLPVNLEDFDATSANITVPTGVTYTYVATSRELRFTIPQNLVRKGSAVQELSFGIKVVNDCNKWRDACSNVVENTASASYNGVSNPSSTPLKAGSFNTQFSACNGGVEGPSNFIVNLDFTNCMFKATTVLCERTVTLQAGANFDNYRWEKVGGGTIGGNSRTLVVSEPGVYKVTKTKAGCATMYEEHTVNPNAYANAVHPIKDLLTQGKLNGEVYICADTGGTEYPQVYLCGGSATVPVSLKITGATAYQWQKLGSCGALPPTLSKECPPSNDNYNCSWTDVGNSGDITLRDEGVYRLVVTYGNCVSPYYYFKVTKNNLDPQLVGRDIICSKNGSITVNGVPAGYQYALRRTGSTTLLRNYQNSNTFDIATPDNYTVLVRQVLTTTITTQPCIFEKSIQINRRTPAMNVTATDMACATNKGGIRIQLTGNPYPPFTYTIRNNNATGGVAYTTVTNTTDLNLTNQFNDGRYFVQVTTPDGCNLTANTTIGKVTELKATASVLRHLSCGSAIVRVTATGGKVNRTNGYGYSNDGGATYQNNFANSYYDFTFTTAGVKNFKVIDDNGCTADVSATVNTLPTPDFTASYTVQNCGDKAKITFSEPTNASSYNVLQYSIDGTNFQSGREFPNLDTGKSYTPVLRYGSGGALCTLTKTTITIPTFVGGNLIASVGVEKLVGCGQGTNADKALVRFSNVQGGQAPYEFNFGDGNWTTDRTKWLAPGTYNMSVRDAIGCSRENIRVTVAPRIPEPTFTPSAITYDCQGRGSVTINNNRSNYNYKYYIDGNLVTDNNFRNLTPGTHTITIEYADANPPTKNVLFLEDFGTGRNGGNEYINKAYYLELQDGSMPRNGYGTPWPGGNNHEGLSLADGEYVVSQRLNPNNGAWWQPNDHSGISQGRMFFVNIGNVLGTAGAILYQRPIKDLIPGKEVVFSVALMNLLGYNDSRYPGGAPDLAIELYTDQAAVNANTPLVSERINPRIRGSRGPNDWTVFQKSLNPGTHTELIAVIRSFSLVTNGNDLAMDDIYLYQEPEACSFTYTTTVTIANDKAFGVDPNTERVTQPKCNGEQGSYQIGLKNAPTTYYVQKDNTGSFVATTGNPFKWENIPAGTHTVKIRAEQNNANCEVTRTFNITRPDALGIGQKSVYTLGCNPATADVEMRAIGGVPPYMISLHRGTTTVTSQTVTDTSWITMKVNQAGTYYVQIIDANGCIMRSSMPINVYVPKQLTLTGTTTSANNNYCGVTGTNGKVEVQVNIINTPGSNPDPNIIHTAPYVFQVNGTRVNATAISINNYVIENLGIGVHTITVIDRYGCRATYTTEIKRPLTVETPASSMVTKDISCHTGAAGNAKIELKVKDGYTPYTYVVRNGATIVQTTQTMAGNTATYETATPGTYTIEVTDAKGCKVQASATVSARTNPTITAVATAVGCNGANNGTISVTITGGKAPYTVYLDGVNRGTGAQKVFANLPAKSNYVIRVVDANNCEATQTVAITQPNALVGFAGVSELIGCEPTGANKDKAQVRITNVTGGTPPYQYKFDGNYQGTPMGYLPAGTHTVYVKDANNCELPLTVTVAPRIAEPTGTTYTITGYDCNGNATVSITGTPTTYDYEFIFNGRTYTGTTVTIPNVAPGTYTYTIRYKDANPPASSILLKEDFGFGGDTCITNVSPNLHCSPNATTPQGPGNYVVGNRSSGFLTFGNTSPSGPIWTIPNPRSGIANDRFFIVDVGNVQAQDVLYYKDVNDIDTSKKVKFEMYLYNLFMPGRGATAPNVEIRIVSKATNATLASQQSGPLADHTNPNNWIRFAGELNVTETSIRIEIRTNAWSNWGCDFLVDDIYVYQEPKACAMEITKQVVVPSGNEFRASVVSQTNVACQGENTGKATFRIENLNGGNYTVRVDGVTPPTLSGNQTAPTVEIPNLTAGTHLIEFNYSTCKITRTVTITEPDKLTLTATITQPAMCSNNNRARVTLTAGGGVAPYTYEYLIGGVVQGSPQSSNVFNNVAPGSATFRVTDKNGCVTTLASNLTVPTPATVSFTLQATDCYAGGNSGVVTATVQGGNGGYKFKLNNEAETNPNVNSVTHQFTGLTQGSYTVTVTDQYGCSTAHNIIIRPTLNTNVRVTNESCVAGKIEVTATGGDGTYSYAFAQGSVATVTAGAFGTTNTYNVPTITGSVQTYTVFVKSDRCVKRHEVGVRKAPTVTFDTETVTPTCQGSGTGKIVVKNITGDGNFTVRYGNVSTPVIATFTGIATNTYTIDNLTAGAYSVTVEDRYGCRTMKQVTLQDMPALTASISLASTATCTTGGSQPLPLTISIPQTVWNAYTAGGNQVFFSYDNGANWHPMTSNPFNLAPISGVTEAGKTINLMLSNGASATGTKICTTNATAHVVPSPLGGVSVTTDIGKFEFNCTAAGTPYFTATVTIANGSGNPPYQFRVNEGAWETPTPSTSRTHVFTNLIVGRTYKFEVQDANGCIAAFTGDIYANVATPAMTVIVSPKPACAGGQGEATFRIHRSESYTSGTNAGSTINWVLYEKTPGAGLGTVITSGTAIMPPPGNDATNITPGGPYSLVPNKTYYVVVSEGSCHWGSRDAEIKELAPLTATVSASTTITCDNNGVLEVLNPSGGGGTYTYEVTPVTPGVSFTVPIQTGNSRVQIIKDNIATPAMPVHPDTPYSFAVNLVMKDQYGCSVNLGNYNFTVPPAPKINRATLMGCVNGSISLTIEPQAKAPATSGTSATGAELNDYEYSIDGGLDYQASSTFGNLVAGTYDLQIREKATGCIATLTYTVTANLEAEASLTKALGCGTSGNAEITIKVDRGTGNYNYTISGPAGYTVPSTTIPQVSGKYEATVNNITTAGIYTVTVTDINASAGCNTFTKTITVLPAELPQIETAVKSVTCNGGSDGEIYITEKNATIGTFNYTNVPIVGPAGSTPLWTAATRTYSNLKAGVYTITVEANGCQSVYTVTVAEPTPVTISSTQIVTRQFGCTASGTAQQATISVPNGAISGGTAPYTIEFVYTSPSGTITSTGNTFTVGDIRGGIVTITATDINGCATSTTETIKPFEALDPEQVSVTVQGTPTCNAPIQVKVDIVAAPGMPPLTQSELRYYMGANQPTVPPSAGAPWQTSNVFSVNPNQTYTFWIGHIGTGCVVKALYVAPDPNTFRIVNPQVKNVTCKGNNDGTATFTLSNTVSTHNYTVNLVASGGVTPPTVPAVSGANPTFTITGLAPATYTMTVTSSGTGCVQTYTFDIAEADVALTASISVQSITCSSAPNYDDGQIEITNATGGWGGYQYYVSTTPPTPASAVWSDTNVFTGLTAGTYHVAIRDRGGCLVTLSSTVVLANPNTITGTLSITAQNCTPNSGEITVQNVTGGEGSNYMFQLIRDGELQGAAQTSTVFTGLGAGTYQVAISDSWGCTATLTQSVTLYDPIDSASIGVVFIKQITCNPATGATLSVTHQGGSTNLRYTLTNNAGATPPVSNNTGIFTNVGPGVYKVSIADLTTGCATVTGADIDVTDAATVSFTYTTTAVTCHGASNGRLVITIPGTQVQTDYQINIVGAGGSLRSETVNVTPKDIEFDAMPAGVYTVTLTSSRNCTATEVITIGEPDELVVSSTTVTTHFKCDADNNAQQAIIQAVGRGGTGSYTFNFEVFDGTTSTTSGWVNNTGVYSVTSNGTNTQTVIVYIRDTNGCQADNSANPLVIPPLKRITSIDINRTSQISCNATESITLTINGGNNKGYRIEVTSTGAGVAIPSTQTVTAGVNTANIGFNTPGYYEIKVIDLETDCYATASHTVIDFSDIEVTAIQTKPVSCVGGNDGEITLTVKGYQGNYNYQVLDATTLAPTGIAGTVPANAATERREVITGLASGTYVIRVEETQSPYCTVTTTSVMVSAPTRALTVSPTIINRITCEPNDNKGAFSIDVEGGWGNYQYRLLVGATPHTTYGTYTTTTLFEGLTANTYMVEVIDEGGCSTATNVVMAPPTPISASISATTVLNCFNDRTGVITVVSPTGGSGNYAYELWNVGGDQIGGAQTSTTFTNLYAGSYNVKIIDGWGCDVTIPVTIDEPDEMKVTASIVSPLTCLQQATISITVTGGTPGYTYYMVANGTATSTLVGNTTQAGVGEYEFYVIDSHGCQSKLSNKITIEVLQPLQLHVDETDAYVKCNGDSTAKITFSATGALGNYQYKLYKGGVAQTATATQENATDWAFGGLSSGTYQVEVISVDCVATSTLINIGEAGPLSVATASTDISCNGEADGTISVTVTGGTGRILYAISPRLDRFVDSGYFTKLARGNYIVRAQDENGCYTDTTFEIKEPDLLVASVASKTNEVCKDGNDGTVSITISGGTASYSTSIDNVTWTVGKTLYTGLASGTYTIYVKDARSCTTEVPVTIEGGVDLQATATVEYSCGNNTVVNTVVASSNPEYAGYVSYRIDGGAPQASGRFVVTSGTHTVTIAHNNGCTQTITVNVEAYTSLTVSSTKTDMSCYGVNDGTITYETTGGTGSYTFTISPQAGNFDGINKFTGLSRGQYIVKVKDNVIGCEVERTFTIVEPDQLIAHASTVTETCYGTNDGALSFRFTGGRAPYNYTLKDPSGNVIGTSSSVATGTVVSRTGIAPGRYQLEYGDSGICSQTLEITVAAAPSINATFEKGFNCSTVSTTWTTGYLMLTFNNLDGALTRSNTSYAINSTDVRDARPFETFEGNRAKTAPIEPGTNQYITVFYRGAGVASTCQETLTERFDIERYPGLELRDKTDPRELNVIKVEGRGGNPPYTYYFNGSYENGSNEYTLKPTDPTSRIVNGRVYKVVTVTVQDANGCEADLLIEKEFMKSVPPNFFTPNDDGSNDGWDPDRFRSYPNLTVDIYDRYGRYITTLRSGQKWDGRYDGKELPAGDYWYILKTHEDGEDAREYMGHFTLYR